MPDHPTVLVYLQNAWQRNAQPGQRTWLRMPKPSQYTDEEWEEKNHYYWEHALWISNTGQRLKKMLPANVPTRIVEASPYIGSTSSSKFSMEPEHCALQLDRWKPIIVLLLGAEALKVEPLALERGIYVVKGVHPTARTYSLKQLRVVRQNLLDILNSDAVQAKLHSQRY